MLCNPFGFFEDLQCDIVLQLGHRDVGIFNQNEGHEGF